MAKFIKKTILYFLICFLITSGVLYFFGSYIDYFYVKFTTPKAASMIIGGSRSMQGIQPSIINKELKDTEFKLPIFNYSFTIAQAPIGPLYNNSIKKKIDSLTTNGLYIISITPWMLASDKKNDSYTFREVDEPPHNMTNVTINPNYEYLLKNLNYFHFQGLFRKNAIMHKDGWLEENNMPKDSTMFYKWKQTQKNMLIGLSNDYYISDIRKESLEHLISFLKRHGAVFLIRTPIDEEILKIENTFFSNFNDYINDISIKHNVSYINFNTTISKHGFRTYDGHHIDKKGGVYFTKAICDSIKNRLLKNSK